MTTLDILTLFRTLEKAEKKLDALRNKLTDYNEKAELECLVEDIRSAQRNFLRAEWH